MSATNDSIQTLLKQRRELRQCLQELRTEIKALNDRAQSISSDGIGPEKKEKTVEAVAALAPVKEKPVETNEQPSGSSPLLAPVTSSPANPDLSNEEQKAEVKPQPEAGNPSAGEKLKKVESENADKVHEGDLTLENEDFLEIDDTSLFFRSKLLADYLLNYPSGIDESALEGFDNQIKAVELSVSEEERAEKSDLLRPAYRAVSTQSYEENRVNGETLADSVGDVTLLWGLPISVACLTLVAFPLILLIQVMAERMFVASFTAEISVLLDCLVAFLWGGSGALSSLAWKTASDVRKRRYQKGAVRDIGLRFCFGGILAIATVLLLMSWLFATGILGDMMIAIISYFIGLPAAAFFSFLFRVLHNRKKVDPKVS